MEVYYKDLISKETSLDALVDELTLVVQGAEEFAEAALATAPEPQREEITTRLQRIKDGYQRIADQAVVTARAADQVVRRHPYTALGFAFGIGLLAAVLLRHRD